MKSRPIAAGQSILASQNNDKRDDARGGSFLLVHQQLGALALGTAPTNGQTVSFVINGTTVAAKAVASVSAANDILNPGTAAGFVANLIAWLRRPDVTNSNQVAASGANQTLLSYVGWAWPGSSTAIVPFSLNKNVNGITGGLASFNVTTTVTSGSWTAQTMQLYVEEGAYYVGATRVLFSGGSTPTFTAPASHPRIDLVTADSAGTIAIVTGTENASPAVPAYPLNKAVLAEVYHVVGETALYDNENQQAGQGYVYNDVRPTLLIPYISSTSQVAAGLFVPDPGSDAQGDLLYYGGAGAWARLPAGTAGYVLKTQGAGANPAWVPFAPLVSASSTDVTATTSDTSLLTVSLPALSANAVFRVRCAADNNAAGGVTANDQWGVKTGGGDLFRQTMAASVAGNLDVKLDIVIANQNSTGSQRGNGVAWDEGSGDATSYRVQTATSVDLSGAGTLTFFYKKASGTQAMRPVFLEVEILTP